MSELKEIRELTGLSQKQIADWLGISRAMVFMIEQNKRRPSREVLFKMSAMIAQLSQQEQAGKKGQVVFVNHLKLAELHRQKMEKQRRLAANTRLQLEKLQMLTPRLQSRFALFDSMKNQAMPGYNITTGDKMAIEILELESKSTAQHTEEQELLQDKIDTHLAIADWHQQRWKMFLDLA